MIKIRHTLTGDEFQLIEKNDNQYVVQFLDLYQLLYEGSDVMHYIYVVVWEVVK